MTDRRGSVLVVVPVKGGPEAKSRLRTPAGVHRERLVTALALDTLHAVTRTRGVEVVVVTAHEPTARSVAGIEESIRVMRDPGGGLDAAVRAGAALAAADQAVAVLLGDVPASRPVDLETALRACAAHRAAFVPDAAGTGTVLLYAAGAHLLHPAFGEGSAAAHETWATRLDLDLPHLRRDVDDADDLAEAMALGAGPRTRRALEGRPHTENESR